MNMSSRNTGLFAAIAAVLAVITVTFAFLVPAKDPAGGTADPSPSASPSSPPITTLPLPGAGADTVTPGGTPGTNPDGSITNPDGSITRPDGTIVKTDGTQLQPDGTVIEPDGTIVKADGTKIRPDGTVIPAPSATPTPTITPGVPVPIPSPSTTPVPTQTPTVPATPSPTPTVTFKPPVVDAATAKANAQKDVLAIWVEAAQMRDFVARWDANAYLDHYTRPGTAMVNKKLVNLVNTLGEPVSVGAEVPLSKGSRLWLSKVSKTRLCIVVENNGIYSKTENGSVTITGTTPATC